MTITARQEARRPPCPQPPRARVQAAVRRAPKVFPGPVGETLAEYLTAWLDYGYRFEQNRPLTGLVCDQVLRSPLPDYTPSG